VNIARAHYENFPVASWLLPRRMRPHVAAVYAFARLADDIADEGVATPDERLARLVDWRDLLRASAARTDIDAGAYTPVFRALGHSIRRCPLDPALLNDLLSAFAQDVTVHRYERWEDVLDYCRRSANPIGRLVLQIAGERSSDATRSSDALCTALQLTNFWQDFGRDWRAGRLYVPLQDATRYGARVEDLAGGRITDAWRGALAEMATRTRALFNEAGVVGDLVSGRLRLELRATWLGGRLILDRTVALRWPHLDAKPTIGGRDLLAILWKTLTWRSTAGTRPLL
jgi:squalene synthase HpnC